MKKTLLNNLKFIAFGLIFAIGMSYVSANTQTPNSATPPKSNTLTPVTIGDTKQEKGIGSPCATSGNNCGLAVAAFMASKNAQFDKNVLLMGPVYGGADKKVHAGDATKQASVNATGRLYTASYFQSDTLAHSGGLVPVCNDAQGAVILCP